MSYVFHQKQEGKGASFHTFSFPQFPYYNRIDETGLIKRESPKKIETKESFIFFLSANI